MQKMSLIGIGTGSLKHVTLDGIEAMRRVDCILLPRKEGKDDLAAIRRDLLRAHAPETTVVAFDMPVRDEDRDYLDGVSEWHDRIAEAWTDALTDAHQHVGLLVWGDPSLYDSTLRIAEGISPKPETVVVPGITALQALTAAHAMPLNALNAPVLITTGRQLRNHGWPPAADRVAVMLDGCCSFQSLSGSDFNIWWGAYLGMENQVLKSGALDVVGSEIIRVRGDARRAHGWIMDTYLLEKRTVED